MMKRSKRIFPVIVILILISTSMSCALVDWIIQWVGRLIPQTGLAVETPQDSLTVLATMLTPTELTPEDTVEPSPTHTSEPEVTIEPTPTEVEMIDTQDTFMHRASLARLGVYQSPGPKRTPGLVWEFVAGDLILSAPVIFEGTAYFGCYDGNFYAFEIQTGETLWTFFTGGSVLSSPALADGILYFGNNDGKLYALEAATGKQVWVVETGGRVVSSPAVSEGMVYFGSYDGFLYALDPQTGAEVWKFEVAGLEDSEAGISKGVSSSPAISEGRVLFGSTQVGGVSAELLFYSLDSETGEKLWEFTGWNNLISPAVDKGVVCFGGFGSFYGLEVDTGSLVLDFDTNILTTAPAINQGVAYYGSESGLVFALDLITGQTIWTVDTGSWSGLRTPSVSDGVVYIGSSDGFILALDHLTGEKLWEYQADEGLNTSPVIHGGVLYIGGEAHLFALK